MTGAVLPMPVVFGRSLSTPTNAQFREKILSFTVDNLSKPLCVQTTADIDFSTNISPLCEPTLFLLFDLYRAFLYHDPMTFNSPRIDSIARFVIDDYAFRPFHVLAQHFSANPFIVLYELAALDVIPYLFRFSSPGSVTTIDFRVREIRNAVAHIHPESPTSLIDAGTRSLNHVFSMNSGTLGKIWRAEDEGRIDELVSMDVGPIRDERMVVTGSCLAGSFARVAWNRGNDDAMCSAHRLKPNSARFVARCEALERFQVIFQRPDDESVLASHRQVSSFAIDPQTLFYSRIRANRSPAYMLYDDSIPFYWTWADRVAEDKSYLVPAQEIWFNTRRLPEEHIFIRATTNGCALGSSPEEAALFALCELIERDAYLTMWYTRRSCRKLIPASIGSEDFQVLWAWLAASRPNYRIQLFDISTEISMPAIAAMAVRMKGRGPRTLHSAAANWDAGSAAFGAIRELAPSLPSISDRSALDDSSARALLRDPWLTSTSHDHRALYAMDETFDRLSFLPFEAEPSLTVGELNSRSVLRNVHRRSALSVLIAHLEELGFPVLLKDLTHQQMRDHRLFCVKAIVPGLFPMWYGHAFIRFAVTERLRRIALELARQRLEKESDFNLDVHPFG